MYAYLTAFQIFSEPPMELRFLATVFVLSVYVISTDKLLCPFVSTPATTAVDQVHSL